MAFDAGSEAALRRVAEHVERLVLLVNDLSLFLRQSDVVLFVVRRVVEPGLVAALTVDVVGRLLVPRHLLSGGLFAVAAIVERIETGLDLREVLALFVVLLVEA